MIMIDLRCGNGHVTRAELINPELDAEGFVTGGYAGSDRDFCQVCQSSDMAITGYTEVRPEDEEARQAYEAASAAEWADVAAGDAHLRETDPDRNLPPEDEGEPCDCICHLPGEEPVMVAPQPDAAEHGEPEGYVPCCGCWAWRPCETGVGIATCYHVPRCSWPSPAGWRKGETFGRLVPAGA